MKHLLVPIGSSENAKNTLQYAIDFAQTINAKVFVFRAYNVMTKAGTIINISDIIQRETNLYMRTVVNSVNKNDVDIKLIAAKGSAVDSIKAIDKELGIDLVVLGPKSNSENENAFLGSTSGSIVKQTEIPTLVVPEAYNFKPTKDVLIAFKSGKIHANTVLNPIKNFTNSADLLLVNTPSTNDEDLVIDSELEKIKTKLTIVENETTFKGVNDYLQNNSTDLLCVFRRNRGFFKKLWEKNSILKSEFYCEIPLLILSGKK
jgi:nucleotide-binding universal stress UspA family protein